MYNIAMDILNSNARIYLCKHYHPEYYKKAPETAYDGTEFDNDKFREMATFIMDIMDKDMNIGTAWYRQGHDDDARRRHIFEEWMSKTPKVLELDCLYDGSAIQTLADLYELQVKHLEEHGVDMENAAYLLICVFSDVIEKANKITIDERFDMMQEMLDKTNLDIEED